MDHARGCRQGQWCATVSRSPPEPSLPHRSTRRYTGTTKTRKTTLLASLRRVFPSFGQHLDLVFGNLFSKQGLPTSGVCLSALDAEISEPFVLFLCNYEEINESERLTELVNALLKQLPSQATLVLESRVMPDLAFAQLLVRDEMGGLNRAALRFSARDIAELARLHGLTTLSDEEAGHVQHPA